MIGIILSLSLYHLSIIQLLASIIYRVSQKYLLQNLDHLLAVFRPSLTHPLPFQTIKTRPGRQGVGKGRSEYGPEMTKILKQTFFETPHRIELRIAGTAF